MPRCTSGVSENSENLSSVKCSDRADAAFLLDSSACKLTSQGVKISHQARTLAFRESAVLPRASRKSDQPQHCAPLGQAASLGSASMDLNSGLWFEVKYGTVPRFSRGLRTLDVSDQIIHTSDAAFERDVLKADQPVLLDFWAEWC